MKDTRIKHLGANNVVIYNDSKALVGSYSSVIMELDIDKMEVVGVGKDWDYSTTTSRHLNKALEWLGFYELSQMSKSQKEKYFKENNLI